MGATHDKLKHHAARGKLQDTRGVICLGGISAFQASISYGLWYQGRRASRLPLAIIFRAVGALVRYIR